MNENETVQEWYQRKTLEHSMRVKNYHRQHFMTDLELRHRVVLHNSLMENGKVTSMGNPKIEGPSKSPHEVIEERKQRKEKLHNLKLQLQADRASKPEIRKEVQRYKKRKARFERNYAGEDYVDTQMRYLQITE